MPTGVAGVGVGVGVYLGEAMGVDGFGETDGDGLGENGMLACADDDGVRGDGDAVGMPLLSLGLKYCGV